MTTSKNVLANDVEIKGSIKFSHDLIIDGKIEGEVISDGSLTVGENALIKGEVKTRSVIIFGKVEGNITVAERCELKSNAILVGDIAAGTLAIEEGATFMGQSQVGKKAETKPAFGGAKSQP
jgi:cytoskeletal protein CcmA (bactofilin family)